jgi:hypothetical protein
VITEKDLQEAIAECQGERNPNANTCIKLAAFLTIKEHMYPDAKGQEDLHLFQPQRGYSYAPPPDEAETIIDYDSDTEFGRLINGRKASEILPVVDELVSEVVQTINPRLYAAFIRKIKS